MTALLKPPAFTIAMMMALSLGAGAGEAPADRLVLSQNAALQLAPRETELRTLIGIQGEQDAAWTGYVLARREHERNVKLLRRQEMREFASGKPAFEPSFSGSQAEAPVEKSKQVLREAYDRLYAVLDADQQARADEVLTPAECGR